jgi:hypothetical protein
MVRLEHHDLISGAWGALSGMYWATSVMVLNASVKSTAIAMVRPVVVVLVLRTVWVW